MSLNNTNQRINFATIKNPYEFPDFLEIQLKSFQDFLQLDTPPEKRKKEGLYKVFMENFPITDTRNNFVLEFLDYYVDPPRYSIEECLERGLTYSVPLKAKLYLYCTDPDHEDFAPVIQDVYLGTIPYMTERGTFVINGAERVVVSQLHRSPGVFSVKVYMQTEPNFTQLVLFLSKVRGLSLQPTSIASCMLTSIGKEIACYHIVTCYRLRKR